MLFHPPKSSPRILFGRQRVPLPQLRIMYLSVLPQRGLAEIHNNSHLRGLPHRLSRFRQRKACLRLRDAKLSRMRVISVIRENSVNRNRMRNLGIRSNCRSGINPNGRVYPLLPIHLNRLIHVFAHWYPRNFLKQ